MVVHLTCVIYYHVNVIKGLLQALAKTQDF